MELKRNIYKKILDWKIKSKGSSALLIEGARRVGKSTIAEKFGKENYKSYVIIDFRVAPKIIKDNFYYNLTSKRLDIFFQTISVEYGVQLYIRESLIIFDEVQEFPKAREAIKDLVKDGRYDYLETGSLISIKENVKDIVIPSEEKAIKMYPLTFDEFLIAENEEGLLNLIKSSFENKKPLEDYFHKRAMHAFFEYMIVGGMPQSVVAYLENHRDFSFAEEKKEEILTLYKNDIKKASKKYQLKVTRIFESIPGFLSKHNNRVIIKELNNKKEKFSNYLDAFYWLEDAMLCNLCYKANDPSIGLALSKDDSSLKCYLLDTGLLLSMVFASNNSLSLNAIYNKLLHGRLSINKGMLFENTIAQIIASSGKNLYYYSHYSIVEHKEDIEIDFLLDSNYQFDFKITPIEVKSSKNYSTISYNAFKKKFNSKIGYGYIIHPKQFKIEDNTIFLPCYMAFLLSK